MKERMNEITIVRTQQATFASPCTRIIYHFMIRNTTEHRCTAICQSVDYDTTLKYHLHAPPPCYDIKLTEAFGALEE